MGRGAALATQILSLLLHGYGAYKSRKERIAEEAKPIPEWPNQQQQRGGVYKNLSLSGVRSVEHLGEIIRSIESGNYSPGAVTPTVTPSSDSAPSTGGSPASNVAPPTGPVPVLPPRAIPGSAPAPNLLPARPPISGMIPGNAATRGYPPYGTVGIKGYGTANEPAIMPANFFRLKPQLPLDQYRYDNYTDQGGMLDRATSGIEQLARNQYMNRFGYQ